MIKDSLAFRKLLSMIFYKFNLLKMEKKIYLFFFVMISVGILSFSINRSQKINKENQIEQILKKYSEDVNFEKNNGQWNDQVLYKADAGQTQLQFLNNGVHFSVFGSDNGTEKREGHAWKMNFEDMNTDVKASGKSLKANHTSYLNGNGSFKNIEEFAEVWYENVYPGTDVRFYNRGEGIIEYDFVVHPNANPNNINLNIEGVNGIEISEEGTLVLNTSLGPLAMGKPYTYQVIDGVEKEIASEYKVEGNNFTFAMLEDYDIGEPLIIDPVILEFSAGISSNSFSNTVAHSLDNRTQLVHDSDDNIYYAFTATDNVNDITTGAFQSNAVGDKDIVIGKMSADGSTILYQTFLGGVNGDFVENIQLDASNNLYISGFTNSLDFPTTPGAFSTTHSLKTDIFITKLDPSGSSLVYSTFVGGSGNDQNNDNGWDNPLFEVNAAGEVYKTSNTTSSDFPTTTGAFQESFTSANSDLVAFKLSADGSTLIFSTYLDIQNSGDIQQHSAVVNSNGEIIINTSTNYTSYSTTAGAAYANPLPGTAGLPTLGIKLSADGSSLEYATYLGDFVQENLTWPMVILDSNEEPIFGLHSKNPVPATAGALNESITGTSLNLVKLSNDGSQVLNSMIVRNNMIGMSFEINSLDEIVVLGLTGVGDLPVTPNNIKDSSSQQYLAKYSSDFTTLVYGTYLLVKDQIVGLEIDTEDNMHVLFKSSLNNSLLTDDAFQSTTIQVKSRIFNYLKFDENDELVYATLFGENRYSGNGLYLSNSNCAVIFSSMNTIGHYPITDGSNYTEDEGSFIGIAKFCSFCGPVEENIIEPAVQTHCIFGSPDPFSGNEIEPDLKDYYLGSNPSEILSQGETFAAYQWQQSADGVTGWTDIPGAVLKDYLPSELAVTTYYRRIIKGEGCNGNISESNIAVINITSDTAPVSDAGGEFLICETGSIQIGQLATGGTGTLSYNWDPSTGLDNPNIAQPIAGPASSAVYTVEVTDENGCLHRDQAVVTVIAPDAGPDKSACDGLSVQIGTPGLPVATGVSYSWAPTEGLSDPNIAQPIALPTSQTTYTLTMLGPNGCPQTDDVVVSPLTVTADASPDVTICFGDFAPLGEVSEPNTMYGWAPGLYLTDQTASNPNSQPNEMPLPEDNPIEYTVTKIDLITECFDTDDVLVYVNIADAADDGCGPRFIGTPDHSLGRATFAWTVISGDMASLDPSEVNIPRPFVAPSETTIYELNVTWNGVTCTDQVVVPPCGCTLGVGYSSDYDCLVGGNNTYIWAIGQDTTLYDYVWTPTTGLVSPNSAYTEVLPLAANTTYTLQSYLKNDGSLSCSDTEIVFAAPATYPQTMAQSSVICDGQSTNLGFPAISGWSYEWFPDTDLSDPFSSNPTATPNQTRTYTLVVTDLITECTADTTITVEVRNPIIDAGPDGEFCNGAIIQLGTPAIGDQTYSWEPQIGLAGFDTPQPIDTIYTDAEYILTVTDPLTGCFIKDTVNYVLDMAPIADAGVDQEICPGGSVSIGAPSVEGYIYQWAPVTGLSDATIAQPIVTVNTGITYTLSVGNGNQGCYDSDEVVITIGTCTPPTVDPGSDQDLCTGESVQLGTPAVGGITYSWSPTTGLDNPTAAQPNANPTETTTYTLTVDDGTATNSASVTVTVWNIPTADAGSDLTACEDEGVKIGTASEAGMTYAWTPAGDLDDATKAQPIATLSSNTTFTVVVTNEGGCTASDDMTVTVATAPNADAGADVTTCDGVQIGTAAVTDVTYSWSPTTGLDDATIAQPTANPNAETEYTVTATDAAGCTSTDSVIVSPSAEADAGADKSVCEGSGKLIGSPDNSGGTATYSWSPSTGLDNASIAQPMASPTETTTYELTVSAGGCTKTDQVVVTVNANSADAGADQYICGGSSVVIGTPEVAGKSYLWSPSAGLDDNTKAQPLATPSSNTTYTVVVIDNLNGCAASDDVTIALFGSAPVADAGADAVACNGDAVQLGAAPVAGLTYSWSPTLGLSDPFIANPTASTPFTTTYTLQVFDATTGCSNIDKVDVSVENCAGIGNYTWYDVNNDGIQQGPETPVTNVTVNLIENGVIVATEFTDSDGFYFFDDVPTGNYCIEFDASTSPDGSFAIAQQNQGADSEADSDVNQVTGKTSAFNFNPENGNDLSIDAGFILAQDIGDFVWYDTNGDGQQDGGEVGIEGVTVTLFDEDGLIVATTTTDENGYYLFEDVPLGTGYCVSFDESTEVDGYDDLVFSPGDSGSDATDSDANQTTGKTAPFEVVAGTDKLDIDAGLYECIKVGDYVWEDYIPNGVQDGSESPIENVTVTIYDDATGLAVGTTMTDENGYYEFCVPEGDYYLKFNAATTGSFLLITTQDTGSDDETDNDTNPNNGETGVYSITLAGGDDTSIDAGFYDPNNRLLPVEWGYFEAKNKDCKNILKWGTITEDNTSHFEILRSFDNERYEVLDVVEAVGFSAEEVDYQFIDKNPFVETYYKIRSVDFDGEFQFSNTLFVKSDCFPEDPDMVMYPNPTLQDINIKYNALAGMNEINIRIMNILGQQVKFVQSSLAEGPNLVTIDVSSLPAGEYILMMSTDGVKESKVEKFIKIDE